MSNEILLFILKKNKNMDNVSKANSELNTKIEKIEKEI